jgi:hypothetical protein
MTLEDDSMRSEATPRRRRPRRASLRRLGYSLAEVARAIGQRPDALRRLVERHAEAEGDELVARLTGGMVARKRKGMGRWMVVIPPTLRAELARGTDP